MLVVDNEQEYSAIKGDNGIVNHGNVQREMMYEHKLLRLE